MTMDTKYHVQAIYDRRRELFYGIVYSSVGHRMAGDGIRCPIGHPYRELAIDDAKELMERFKGDISNINDNHEGENHE